MIVKYIFLILLLKFLPVIPYNPYECDIESYYFTFLRDGDIFKVHGLWPESCAQCEECGYPSCCIELDYVYPEDPTNFIDEKWFYSLTHNDCNGEDNVILFEHEYYKHGTCMDINNTTDYLNIVIDLYDKYYDDNVNNKCDGYHQLWLYLDENKDIIDTLCS